MVIFSLTQHAGLAEDVLDHRLNCRTVYMNPIFRFLYWEMNYHVEHHMFPMVPYHALGKLHQELKADMPKPYNSLWEAYREIIPTLIREVKEPTYFVRRQLPARRQPVSALDPALPNYPMNEIWIEVCHARRYRKGRRDALRSRRSHLCDLPDI